jgi:hypothetical protein
MTGSAKRVPARLVDRPGHRLVADQLDHPADLAPAAEMDEIAEIAASVRAQGRLRSGMGAEAFDQQRRLGEGGGLEDFVLKQTFPPGIASAVSLAEAGFKTPQGDA